MPLSHEQRSEAAGLIAGLAIVALLAFAVVVQAGWLGLHQAPATRPAPLGPGAEAQGREFLKDGARWRVGQFNWDNSPAMPSLRVMVWHQSGATPAAIDADFARGICNALLPFALEAAVPAVARNEPWTMHLRIYDASGRTAGPFDLGVGQTPTGSPYCFAGSAAGSAAPGRTVTPQPQATASDVAAAPAAADHPFSFVFPLPIGEKWVVTVVLAHPGTGEAPAPPGVAEARRACAEILAALPSPLAPGMTAGNVRSVLVSYRYDNGTGEKGPFRTVGVEDGGCVVADVAAAESGGADAVQAAAPVKQKAPRRRLEGTALWSSDTRRNLVARRGVFVIERESWQRTQAGLGWRLWIASARRIARDVPMEMTPLTAWSLCSSVLADLPEGRPEGIGREDFSWVAFHMPGTGAGTWVRQPVEGGICVLPENTDSGDWLRAR